MLVQLPPLLWLLSLGGIVRARQAAAHKGVQAEPQEQGAEQQGVV